MIVRIGFFDLALRVHDVHGEVARTMEVQIRVECLGVEAIDGRGVMLRDVALAHGFADHRAILTFR